jgi:hypothetical protein
MRPRSVTGLAGRMTSDLPPDPRPQPTARRPSRIGWTVFLTLTAVLAFLALLPAISAVIVVALWGLGGSGSNK